jgi:hemerythrin-like domain-containing protein
MDKTPSRILEDEHHFIKMAIGALEVIAEKLDAGKLLDASLLREIVDFMRTYADKDHHGKEEALMFPALEKKGVPINGCPLGALIYDHKKGRELVKELAETTEMYVKDLQGTSGKLVLCIKGLINLYPTHIWREDYLLFPMTDKILTPEEQQDLYDKFQVVEKEFGKEEHDRYERFAEGLLGRANEL